MRLDGITYVFKGAKQKHAVAIDVGNKGADGTWPAHVNGNPTRLNSDGKEYPTPEFVAEQLLKDAE